MTLTSKSFLRLDCCLNQSPSNTTLTACNPKATAFNYTSNITSLSDEITRILRSLGIVRVKYTLAILIINLRSPLSIVTGGLNRKSG